MINVFHLSNFKEKETEIKKDLVKNDDFLLKVCNWWLNKLKIWKVRDALIYLSESNMWQIFIKDGVHSKKKKRNLS